MLVARSGVYWMTPWVAVIECACGADLSSESHNVEAGC